MEFKKLSDVEVVETVSDSANVLIEENGVIKKAPKTQVGGAGGGNAASGAPYLVKINSIGGGSYQLDGDFYEIFDIIETGVLVYAAIYDADINKFPAWGTRFYFSHYSMPNSDVLDFYNPEGDTRLRIYDSNSVEITHM